MSASLLLAGESKSGGSKSHVWGHLTYPCKVTEDFYETTRCYEDWAPTPWLPAVPNRLLSAMWTGCQWGNQAAAARGRFREVGRLGLLAALMGVFFFFWGGQFS